jgi:glycosyltransferase involved in cell wall biosynthesis
MKIGVWHPLRQLTSVKIYTTQVEAYLEQHGVELHRFGPGDKVPEDMDLYWDPWCTDGKNPNRRLLGVKAPIVVTVHGMASEVLSKALQPKFYKKWGWLQKPWKLWQRRFFWRLFRSKVKAVITVSHYAKTEIAQYLGIPAGIIFPVYHGVDKTLFFPLDAAAKPAPYFFHVSAWQPKKNVARIVAAYRNLPEAGRWPLIIVSPGCREALPQVPGLTLITQHLPSDVVARYMQEAGAFVFPSLHESFGMPLAEAMACGVPIITADATACREVAGDAALLVNPEEVGSISVAMQQLMENTELRNSLSVKALERSGTFSWERCGEGHLGVMRMKINFHE